jgi:[acyl-carrier-protein] S-malonyltransferase
MKAYIFPGQGSQFSGMGQDLYDNSAAAKSMFEKANDILGFRLTDIMFSGTDEELKQTRVTQPAIFLHSVVMADSIRDTMKPDMVAGHSLGEFSALVANRTLAFEDALTLVYKRALAMQKACEQNPSTMAAVLNLDDKVIEDICAEISAQGDVVVAANYNCPGQLVISGTINGVNIACEKMKAAGAKRALVLPVGGAFHSPLMEPARVELEAAINSTNFSNPICPVYQNVTASAVSDPAEIKKNLIAQLTAPVRWTQTVQQMISDGATHFTEVGPGKVLQGLVKKVNAGMETASAGVA